jgi:integrase
MSVVTPPGSRAPRSRRRSRRRSWRSSEWACPRRSRGDARELAGGADVCRVRPGGGGGGQRRDPPGLRVVLERIIEHWGSRRLDEPTPSEIRQLMTWVKTHVVARRNARGGRSAQEHLVAALRCLYQRAVEDGLIAEADNPARKVAKPRRLPSTRRAVPESRLAEINQAAATTGDDPELDTLLLRLHTETACRRGGALALRLADLDPDQCLVLLREKGETVRWQPVFPTLMARLVRHGQDRHAPEGGQLLRYADGRPITAAGMTTCGHVSGGICRGCGPSRSAPTGSGTRL